MSFTTFHSHWFVDGVQQQPVEFLPWASYWSFCSVCWLLLLLWHTPVVVVGMLVVGMDDDNEQADFPVLATLPLGDVNLVVLTDDHSWVAGHNIEHEPNLSIDYGTVSSFYEKLYTSASEQGKELFFVMNGDFMDGTGLGLHLDRLFAILEKMPFSVINLGNHELFFNDNLLAMKTTGFLDHWQGKFLTSNTVWTDNQLPIGNRFTYLTTQHSTTPKNILVFGFLFDFPDACSLATVQKVDWVVQQDWFIDVLNVDNTKISQMTIPDTTDSDLDNSLKGGMGFRKPPDGSDEEKANSVLYYQPYQAILVLAHMDHRDPLIDVIRTAIRNITQNYDLPIQFIAGHSHIRGYTVLDPMSTSFEAGAFLDTIGFVTFPWKPHSPPSSFRTQQNRLQQQQQQQELDFHEEDDVDDDESNEQVQDQSYESSTYTGGRKYSKLIADLGFRHVFLDANKKALQDALGGNRSALETARGHALTHFIQANRLSLGLFEIIGCSDNHYRLGLPLDNPFSLWGLYLRDVIPFALENNFSRIFLQRTGGSLRYDLFANSVTLEDAIDVGAVPDEIVQILPQQKMDRDDLVVLFEKLNASAADEKYPDLPKYGIAPWPDPWFHHRHTSRHTTFELYCMRRDWPAIQQAIVELVSSPPPNDVSSYATWDLDVVIADLPVVYYKGGEEQTSYGVWINFIQENWKCSDPGTNTIFNFRTGLIGIVVGMILMAVARYYCSSRNRNNCDNPRNSRTQSSTFVTIGGVPVRRQNILINAHQIPTQYYLHHHFQYFFDDNSFPPPVPNQNNTIHDTTTTATAVGERSPFLSKGVCLPFTKYQT